MANELSGPSVLTFLAKWLEEIRKTEYSYRIFLYQKQLDL